MCFFWFGEDQWRSIPSLASIPRLCGFACQSFERECSCEEKTADCAAIWRGDQSRFRQERTRHTSNNTERPTERCKDNHSNSGWRHGKTPTGPKDSCLPNHGPRHLGQTMPKLEIKPYKVHSGAWRANLVLREIRMSMDVIGDTGYKASVLSVFRLTNRSHEQSHAPCP